MTNTFSGLNIATDCFDENRTGGIMICGINWGGDPNGEPLHEPASFFSDKSVNNYPYRNRLLDWFGLWGFPLETQRGKEGAFERSLVQTNWLPDQVKTMHGKSIFDACVTTTDNFFRHLQALRPRVILFCGNTLIRVLNDPRCRADAEARLGAPAELRWLQKDVVVNGKKQKRFRVGIQRFAHCDVVGLPHPTGCAGLSNEYVKAFRAEISPVLQAFRSSLTDR